MWKDFFYYSKSERRAVIVLIMVIALLITVIQYLPERIGKNYANSFEADSLELASFLAKVQKQEEKSFEKRRGHETRQKAYQLKTFDPNKADSLELTELGLSSFVVRNIIKYREKGGKFTSAESLSRIYGLEKANFEKLKPYIRISEAVLPQTTKIPTDTLREDSLTYKKAFKYPEGTLVDVGVADTVELQKIPGIGSVISRRIVGYRRVLGGFYDLSQLEELDCITPEMMKWFKLEGGQIQKMAVNRLSLDKLRAHPYLNFYQAKAIIEYRKKWGEIKSLSQLSLFEEFTEKDLNRLSHYFTFD